MKRGRVMPISLKITAEETLLPAERVVESLDLISSSVILGSVRRVRFPATGAFSLGVGDVLPKRANMPSICLSSLAYFLWIAATSFEIFFSMAAFAVSTCLLAFFSRAANCLRISRDGFVLGIVNKIVIYAGGMSIGIKSRGGRLEWAGSAFKSRGSFAPWC